MYTNDKEDKAHTGFIVMMREKNSYDEIRSSNPSPTQLENSDKFYLMGS